MSDVIQKISCVLHHCKGQKEETAVCKVYHILRRTEMSAATAGGIESILINFLVTVLQYL